MTESQFLIYRSEDGRTKIDVMLQAETLWLNRNQFAELIGKLIPGKSQKKSSPVYIFLKTAFLMPCPISEAERIGKLIMEARHVISRTQPRTAGIQLALPQQQHS